MMRIADIFGLTSISHDSITIFIYYRKNFLHCNARTQYNYQSVITMKNYPMDCDTTGFLDVNMRLTGLP